MSDILYDTSRLMHGQLLKFSKAKGFNSLSWNEEQQKESSRDVWRSLYQYEDVSEINGTLQAFTIGLNDDGKLDLNNRSFVQSLKIRLHKDRVSWELALLCREIRWWNYCSLPFYGLWLSLFSKSWRTKFFWPKCLFHGCMHSTKWIFLSYKCGLEDVEPIGGIALTGKVLHMLVVK